MKALASVVLFLSMFCATAFGQGHVPTLSSNNNWTGVNNFVTGNLTLGNSSHQCPQGAGYFMTGFNADFSPNCQQVSATAGVTSVNGRQGTVQLNGTTGQVVITEGPTGTFTFSSPGSGVITINGANGAITLRPGANVSIVEAPAGTFTIDSTGSGGGGSGTVTTGGPHNFAVYTGTNQQTVVPHPNLFELDTVMNLSQINTLFSTANGSIVIPDGVLGAWTYSGVFGTDLRAGMHFHQMSQNGLVCDAQFINTNLTNGSATVSGGPFFTSSVGQYLSIGAQIGGYNGTQWRFTPLITGYTDVNHVTISTPAPFTISEPVWMGTDNSVAFNNGMQAISTHGTQAANGLVGLLPAGCQVLVLSPIVWDHAQSLEGQAGNSTVIVGSPATDLFQVPDASGVNVTSPGLVFGHMNAIMDNSIDPARPYNNVDQNGTVTTPAPMYRPLHNTLSDSNDPLVDGWCILPGRCKNYVANTVQGSGTLCVPNALGRVPGVGHDVVFRDTPTVFKSVVQSISGSCSTGFTGVTILPVVPNTTGYTLTQTEFVESSTGGVNNLSVAITAGSNAFPKTISLAHTIQPIPGTDANVATHGRVKIGNEEYQYIGADFYNQTITLWNGPSTTAGWAIGTPVVPMNPCYAQKETPWPVIPTVNSGDSTPSGARTFPGLCAGNAFISEPQVNGNVYNGGGFFRAHLDDVVVSTNNSDARNSVAGLYIAGNTQPYATTFSSFRFLGVAFCLAEGQASYGQHGIALVGPTGAGDTFVDWSCTAQYPMTVMGNQNGNITRIDAYTTAVNPFDGSAIGSAEALYIGGSIDEQSGNGVQGSGQLLISNWYAEPENGSHIEKPQYLDANCANCTWIGNGFEGAGQNFVGSNNVIKGGQLGGNLSNPVIIYGSGTTIEQTISTVTGKVGNTWGYSSVINWGCYNSISSLSAYGAGSIMMAAPSVREFAYGYDSGSFRDGLAATPYTSDKAGYFPPCDFGPDPGVDPAPFQIGYTPDATAPESGGYVGCNVGPSNVGCAPFHLGGFFGYYYIGQDQRVRDIPYVYTTAIETTSNQSLLVQVNAIDSGNPIDTCSGNANVLSQVVNTVGGVYTTFTFPANFTGRTGCILEFVFQNSTTADVAKVAYVDFEPVPKSSYRATVSSSIWHTACTVAADLGTDGSFEYYCNGSQVVRSTLN